MAAPHSGALLTSNAGPLVKTCSRWQRSTTSSTSEPVLASENAASTPVDFPPPAAEHGWTRPSKLRPAGHASFILQHYHATGCAEGAFSWRAAMLDPRKGLSMCLEPREYRPTTLKDIQFSKEDKRRGGGPRVGPFQTSIPGESWAALPKYDFTTANRSTAFNERMHVEWENHVDHILSNHGELPSVSVVAKAGFRSCAPCCRDMLAIARPTGKAFIMVDLADDDSRGTFHFVAADKYLPVPKEACTAAEVTSLKQIVMAAQDGVYKTSAELCDAVMHGGYPVDETAQALYLGDRALLPLNSASNLRGKALIEVVHAEHFARLSAEYGASILRDEKQPQAQREAIWQCRSQVRQMLVTAWRPHLNASGVDLEEYVANAVAPLLPEDTKAYLRMKRAGLVPYPKTSPGSELESRESRRQRRWLGVPSKAHPKIALQVVDANYEIEKASSIGLSQHTNWLTAVHALKDGDAASIYAASTAVPDDIMSTSAESMSDCGDTGSDGTP